MRLHALADVSTAVAGVRGRLEKIGKLADLLKQLSPEEIPLAVSYLSGALPQGRIGVGWSVVGDARAIAPRSEPSLELREVDETFARIAGISGAGAARARLQQLVDLFSRATEGEQDFLVRLLSGELRQGAQAGVLTEAIAKAAGVSGASVRHAAMMCGDLAAVARTVLVDGAPALERYANEIFRPVEPMLASPTESVADALAAFGEAAFELKLDGARIQVHKSGEEVRVFSRALRDVTAAVPEVVEAVRPLAAREIILDGEVIALRDGRSPLPFQETMRRFGRRLEVNRLRSELPLTPFFFDCLYVDGRALTAEPQRERIAVLGGFAGAYAVPYRVISDERAAS